MDSIQKDVLQYIRSRLLQAGEPVTLNQLCKPLTKDMKKLLLSSKKKNYVEGKFKRNCEIKCEVIVITRVSQY